MNPFFTILGGMGTLATESFVRLLNKRTVAQYDQDYLNYIVVNHANIPDRTAHILDSSKEDPKIKLIEDIKIHSALNPEFFVLTCNTAHYYFEDLQSETEIPILHMPQITVKSLSQRYPKNNFPRVAFLGTEGSVLAGIYKEELLKKGYDYLVPDQNQQQKINCLIYDEIKAKNHLNFNLYEEILEEVSANLMPSVMILGCTELSYIQEQYGVVDRYQLIDAQTETIKEIHRLIKNIKKGSPLL